MSVTFSPTRNRIITRLIEAQTETESGIVLPAPGRDAGGRENGGHDSLTAVVVAVGPGHLLPSGERVTLQVHVGDRVTFDGKDAIMLRLGGEEYLTMREDDIIAVVAGLPDAPVAKPITIARDATALDVACAEFDASL